MWLDDQMTSWISDRTVLSLWAFSLQWRQNLRSTSGDQLSQFVQDQEISRICETWEILRQARMNWHPDRLLHSKLGIVLLPYRTAMGFCKNICQVYVAFPSAQYGSSLGLLIDHYVGEYSHAIQLGRWWLQGNNAALANPWREEDSCGGPQLFWD